MFASQILSRTKVVPVFGKVDGHTYTLKIDCYAVTGMAPGVFKVCPVKSDQHAFSNIVTIFSSCIKFHLHVTMQANLVEQSYLLNLVRHSKQTFLHNPYLSLVCVCGQLYECLICANSNTFVYRLSGVNLNLYILFICNWLSRGNVLAS